MNAMNTMNAMKQNIGLDTSGKKYHCPSCGQKRFVRMKNFDTGELLPDEVGRCDRENSCGYHMTAKQYFTNSGIQFIPKNKSKEFELSNDCPVDYLPFEIMDKSVTDHKRCNLFPFLNKLFRNDVATWLCTNYLIGTNRNGDTVFWQVDISGKIRQAKVMQYNPETGKRNKEAGAFFAGKTILKNKDANFQQCFFGEFLLSYPENEDKPIAIFESEKTAVIASVYLPEYICLATGGKHGAKWTEKNVCKVLAGRKVVLYPDLGAYDAWKGKGLLMAAVAGCRVSVSNILEKNATMEEKEQGLDLADFLLKQKDNSGLALTDDSYPVIWDYNK